MLAVYICCRELCDGHEYQGTNDWEQPFPSEEYAERRLKVKEALEQAGYDGILVTAPRDYHYLTGHDHIWQYRHAVIGLYFDTASGEYVFFDNTSHKVLISNTPEIKDIWYHSRSIPAAEQAKELANKISGAWLGGW